MARNSREMAMSSPYFEAIRQKDYEILFLYEPYDEMILLQLNQFKSKALSGIEQENLVDKNKDDLIIEGDARSLSNIEAQELKDWFKSTLSNKIKYVKVNFQIDIFINFANKKKIICPVLKITNKLDTHPCIITTENMSFLRHLIKTSYLQREKINDLYKMVNIGLEINPRNGLIKTLYSLHKKDPELAKAIAEQVT